MEGNENEDDESESSSSLLENFRREWEAELTKKTSTSKNSPPNSSHSNPSTPHSVTNVQTSQSAKLEEDAKRFFLMGVGFERRGDLYDAVRYYRRAVQLVPDIEHRLSTLDQSETEEQRVPDEYDDESRILNEEINDNEDGNEDDCRGLYAKFLESIENNGWIFFEKLKEEDKRTHISELPVELLIYILRWVVSSELDVRTLDVVSSVSKGFFCLARDETLWKMASDKVWSKCNLSETTFSCYREMFLRRPRVRFDGCYISRLSYVRPGEHSFQDSSYRPWHMVEYFRYIRFFPNGTLYFLTTAEKPSVTVSLLNKSVNASTLRGTYHYSAPHIVTATLRKINNSSYGGKIRKSRPPVESITEFHMDFELSEMKGRANWALNWTYYAVYMSGNSNGNNDGITEFELSSAKYPPLLFSRVKSYTSSSQNILS